MFKTLLIVSLLATAATSAFAQGGPHRAGTPEQQKACSPDVSRHCRAVMKENDFVVLGCLKAHRPKLSKACLKVLTDNGQ
jgi:hypothetical protein